MGYKKYMLVGFLKIQTSAQNTDQIQTIFQKKSVLQTATINTDRIVITGAAKPPSCPLLTVHGVVSKACSHHRVFPEPKQSRRLSRTQQKKARSER